MSGSPEETEALGYVFARRVGRGTIIVLTGPLGSGKTTFVKGLARGLGIEDVIVSPSFVIMVEYEGSVPLCHIDLYRTGSDEELELLGLADKLAENAVIVVEWGEKAESLLPRDRVTVDFSIESDGTRTISIGGAVVEHIAD